MLLFGAHSDMNYGCEEIFFSDSAVPPAELPCAIAEPAAQCCSSGSPAIHHRARVLPRPRCEQHRELKEKPALCCDIIYASKQI